MDMLTIDENVLLHLVKVIQKRGWEGKNGGWKKFLNGYDSKGSRVSDPSKRSREVLLSFIGTFENEKEEDLNRLLNKINLCVANSKLIKKESSDKEIPEQQRLVRMLKMTLDHPLYPVHYALPSYNEDWIVTKIGKKFSKVRKSTKMLAVDCEMVRFEDGSEKVVRVGVVDRNLQVVLDESVDTTQSILDIQKKMDNVLSKRTVLLGHSLYNELEVLKIDHQRVIDTAFVFNYANARNSRRPSLNNLCKSVLGDEVQKEGRNCVDYAKDVMRLILAVVENGADTTIPQTKEGLDADKARLKLEKKKLFLHKMPPNFSAEDVKEEITGEFTIKFMPPKKLGGLNSAIIVFNSREEAEESFESIPGELIKDRAGLPQKVLKFTNKSGGGGGSFCVRKTVAEDSEVEKRANTESSKRQKRKRQKREEEDCEETKESNVEIEELKEQVRAKDKEIDSLKKQLEKKQCS